jgi:subtilisin family serine protease
VADIQNYQDLAAHDLLWQQLIAGAANPTLKKRRQRQQEQRALIVESIKALHERRIPVVVSAGNFYTFSNNGAPGMAFPAIVSEAVAVGAVYDDELPCGRRYAWLPRIPEAFSTRPGQITPFSQRLHQNVNPQAYTKVFAPGSLVTATGSRGREDSSTQEGTSQAAPVTTGVILLMQELYYAKQHQLPPVADLVRWLHQSGSPIHDSDDGYDNVNHTGLSYQALNAFAAFKQMEAEIDP